MPNPFAKIAAAVKKVGGDLEDRTDRRVAEAFSSVLEKLDEDNVLTELVADAADGVADRYEIVIPEIRIRLRKLT